MRKCKSKLLFPIILLALATLSVFAIHSCKTTSEQSTSKLARVAHAGGGIQGRTYTNSIEALEKNSPYFTLFEIDLSLTSDGEIVCIHDWNISAEAAFGRRFDPPPTLLEFQQLIGQTKDFTNCTIESLTEWLHRNPGKKIVTDIKDNNIFVLGKISSRYPELRESFIPQIYHVDEYGAVINMGFRDIILTLYRWDAIAPYILVRALPLKLFAITMPLGRARYSKYFETFGFSTYIHTINKEDELAQVRSFGATEIYTDWLLP